MILGQSAGMAAVLSIDEGVTMQDITCEKLKSGPLKDGADNYPPYVYIPGTDRLD